MRPQTVSDLTLQRPIIDRLQKMVETKSVMNMVFYGKVGTGKTSAACLFADCAEVTVFGRAVLAVGWFISEKCGFCQNGYEKLPFVDRLQDRRS